jgi:cytoskeletal protein CcmA (bactofilin family)
MALFKSNKEKTETTTSTKKINTATIITNGTKIIGNITGQDTIHIDGEVEGSIMVDNIVVIGKSGIVNGDIEANEIISSGTINGNIKCDSLEVLETSTIKENIEARKVEVKGKVQGDVLCDGLIVELDGYVEDRVQAKSVIVSGSLVGEVACDLLSTKQTGYVKGSMYVNNISNEGGKVEGSIGQYKELLTSEDLKQIESEDEIEELSKESRLGSSKARLK